MTRSIEYEVAWYISFICKHPIVSVPYVRVCAVHTRLCRSSRRYTLTALRNLSILHCHPSACVSRPFLVWYNRSLSGDDRSTQSRVFRSFLHVQNLKRTPNGQGVHWLYGWCALGIRFVRNSNVPRPLLVSLRSLCLVINTPEYNYTPIVVTWLFHIRLKNVLSVCQSFRISFCRFLSVSCTECPKINLKSKMWYLETLLEFIQYYFFTLFEIKV